MTREEAECKMQKKVCEIAEILKAYNPDSNYFSLQMRVKDNWASGNNEYWPDGEDKRKPICFYGRISEEDKEHAPSANDASAAISISINDNMTENQEVISDALKHMFKVYARIYSKKIIKGRKQDGKKEEN